MIHEGLAARPFSASRGSTPGGRLLGSLLATALLVAAAALVTRLAGTAALGLAGPTDLVDAGIAAVAVALSSAARRFLARGFGPSSSLFAAPLLLLAVAAGAAVPVVADAAPGWVLAVALPALAGAVVLLVLRLRTGSGDADLVGAVSPSGRRTVDGEAALPHLTAAVVVSVLGVVLGGWAALTWLAQVP